ncbi:Phage tail assembly chaperone protein [uncultured Caudovirales phage]|uniref:Phage tail assembly chaperone protein n=1 Tax=uncultured Caudovirales phage TaxID=2100421 RepID=A0A6J5PBT8_9CAUD|nr:Phage tail assembly chaperone protein [uncultured Caudovirales phage]
MINWKNCVPVTIPSNLLSDSEIVLYVKTWRNAELLASDWTQLPDIETNKVDVPAWKIYRQQLRDMLDTETPVKDIVFPTPPV